MSDASFENKQNFSETLIFFFEDVKRIFSALGISGPEDIILWLLSLSTLIFVMSKIGLLPAKIERTINRNQRSEIATALDLLGVREQEVRSRFRSLKFQGNHSLATIKKRANDLLKAYEISKTVYVGQTNPAEQKSFVDLMSGSTSKTKSIQMATLVKNLIDLKEADPEIKGICDFDYVATPKSGSPFIGYEFAHLVEKPFMVHSLEPKYRNSDGSAEAIAHFDIDFYPEPGKIVLGRVDKKASHRGAGMIQAGICNGDQLGTRPDVGRGMGVL